MISAAVCLWRKKTKGLILMPRKYNLVFTEKMGKTLAK